MNIGTVLKWGVIVVVALVAFRWIESALSSGMVPLTPQQGGINVPTNLTPLSGPNFVVASYNSSDWWGPNPFYDVAFRNGGSPARRFSGRRW